MRVPVGCTRHADVLVLLQCAEAERRVRSVVVELLRAVHLSLAKAGADDAVVRAACALRLGALLSDALDHREAVQVLRSGLSTITVARDASVRYDLHRPDRADDLRALSHASASVYLDAATATTLRKRAGAGAYVGRTACAPCAALKCLLRWQVRWYGSLWRRLASLVRGANAGIPARGLAVRRVSRRAGAICSAAGSVGVKACPRRFGSRGE